MGKLVRVEEPDIGIFEQVANREGHEVEAEARHVREPEKPIDQSQKRQNKSAEGPARSPSFYIVKPSRKGRAQEGRKMGKRRRMMMKRRRRRRRRQKRRRGEEVGEGVELDKASADGEDGAEAESCEGCIVALTSFVNAALLMHRDERFDSLRFK